MVQRLITALLTLVALLVLAAVPAAAQSKFAVYISEPITWATSVPNGGVASKAVTVYGAVLGDFCLAGLTDAQAQVLVTCNVTSNDRALVTFYNRTGGPYDVDGLLSVMVLTR